MEVLEKVKERLNSFGYETTDADAVSLVFIISKVKQSIKNQCNLPEVPDELQYVLVDWVCGEFLSAKYGAGTLDIDTLDLDGALASLSEGDVSISFDNSTSDDAKFQSLIKGLGDTGKDELLCFRKLRW